MRSKLAISAFVVASLFGSTLIASAQSQPAPPASSEGNVVPGATSGKKTKHEKGYDHRVEHAQRYQEGRRDESHRIKTTLLLGPRYHGCSEER